MVKPTRKSLEHILGPLDDNTLFAILATGANLDEVTEAKAILEGKSDIAGQGERAIPGPIKELLTILRGKRA